MTMFNTMSAASAERHIMLGEEAAEVGFALGKLLRHGPLSRHPDGGPCNKDALSREVGDFIGIAMKMCQLGDLDTSLVAARALAKWERSLQYTHYQEGSPKP